VEVRRRIERKLVRSNDLERWLRWDAAVRIVENDDMQAGTGIVAV
jgi:hypothetical protein